MSRRGPRRKSSDSLPALPRNGLRVVPLGGLGEIGRNMTVFEHAGRLLIVDCGVLFPEEHQPGVDVILPDFTWIRDRLDKVDAIVLTHGHEDHIGGVPYLLRERPDIPVVGSRLTLAFIEAKLKEHRITPRTVEVAEGDRQHVRPLRLRVRRRQPLDPRRAGGRHPHRRRAWCCTPATSRWTSSRSTAGSPTCAPSPGSARRASTSSSSTPPTPRCPASPPPSGSSRPAIEQVFRTAPRRVIVSSFASHVHRIQQVLDAAQRHGRKVAFVGRSMVRNMGIARELGYLKIPDGPGGRTSRRWRSCRDQQDRPDLHRLAGRADGGAGPDGQPRPPDPDRPRATPSCMASSLIPGNENAIYRVINALTRWGANVVHKGNAKVHVSGHASAGELAYCYNIVRPTNVMPVHGEWRHLRANADIAIRTGVDPKRVRDRRGRRRRRPRRRPGDHHRQGAGRATSTSTAMTVGGATEATLKDRRTLAEEGVVTIVCIVDADTGKLPGGPRLPRPRLPARGAGLLGGHARHPGGAHQGRRATASRTSTRSRSSCAARPPRWAHRTHRRSPLIIPVIVDA